MDMTVKIAGVPFKNPVIAASGTFAFGEEYALYMDLSELGGISLKALTKEKRIGNPPPRIAETASGILNAVGLQNPGVDNFLQSQYSRIKKINTVQIANIAGATVDEYVYVAQALNKTEIDLYEINVSCPNVDEGGVNFGTDATILKEVVRAVKDVSEKPIIVKLTPNVTDIVAMAKAAKEAGADGLSLINTLTGMAIDPITRKPILANITGGLSGPAIKPIALRMMHEVYQAKLGLPIIGMGGIMSGIDAAEFMMAGADAVMVGTATIKTPTAMQKIKKELEDFGHAQKLDSIQQLTGSLLT